MCDSLVHEPLLEGGPVVVILDRPFGVTVEVRAVASAQRLGHRLREKAVTHRQALILLSRSAEYCRFMTNAAFVTARGAERKLQQPNSPHRDLP